MSDTISLNRSLNSSDRFDAPSLFIRVSPIIIGNTNAALAKPYFPNFIRCSCNTSNGNNFSGSEPSLNNFQIKFIFNF